MRIYIPTLARNDNQITLRGLPPALLKETTLVIDKADNKIMGHDYNMADNLLVCPARGIGKVRQWIIDNHDVKKHGPNLLMLDDDLRFFTRRADDSSKFEKAQANEKVECVKSLDSLMCVRKYAHAGILAREGGNRVTVSLFENTRLLRALAYNVEILRKEKIRFDRLPVMEDFDVALQLIERGYKNVAICDWVQDQTKSNAPGGCSTYRTLEVQAEGAKGLARLHPKSVQLVEKTTSTAWNGATRTDVRVYWKKAFKDSAS